MEPNRIRDESSATETLTPAARFGALILVVFGSFLALLGTALLMDSPSDTLPGLPVLSALQVVVGVFAWRGRGWARILGACYAVTFGLGALAALSLGSSLGTEPVAIDLGLGVISLGYLYAAAVFMFGWTRRPCLVTALSTRGWQRGLVLRDRLGCHEAVWAAANPDTLPLDAAIVGKSVDGALCRGPW